MEKFYEKLRSFDEKKAKIVQIVAGIFMGILVWATILLSGATEDKLLGVLFLGVFLVIVIMQNKIRKEVGWDMKTFRMYWVISMAGSMAVTAIYWLATGKFGG